MNKFQSLVLSIAMAMVLTVPTIGTAKAQGSDCALIGSKAPPFTSIVEGFNADWPLAFSYQPFINQNCSLNARITMDTGNVELGILQITQPYHCNILALTDGRCSGTATTRADLSIRLHGRAVGQSLITVDVNGHQFFYSVFVVSPTKLYLPVIMFPNRLVAANRESIDNNVSCGTVSLNPSPTLIGVGEAKYWDVFDFSPSTEAAIQGNCPLTATLTVSPAIVGFKNYSIDLPYHCERNGQTAVVCSGTANQMGSLLVQLVGLASGTANFTVKVNELTASWQTSVVGGEPPTPQKAIYLPLVNR